MRARPAAATPRGVAGPSWEFPGWLTPTPTPLLKQLNNSLPRPQRFVRSWIAPTGLSGGIRNALSDRHAHQMLVFGRARNGQRLFLFVDAFLDARTGWWRTAADAQFRPLGSGARSWLAVWRSTGFAEWASVRRQVGTPADAAPISAVLAEALLDLVGRHDPDAAASERFLFTLSCPSVSRALADVRKQQWPPPAPITFLGDVVEGEQMWVRHVHGSP